MKRYLSISRIVALSTLVLVVLAGRTALADDTIKRPGDHPDYSVEIEPHGVWGWQHYAYVPEDGFGIGARFSIPIADHAFVPNINDTIAISFGVDWVHYSGGACAYVNVNGNVVGCVNAGDANFLFFPVTMQWNFYVARQWSVFAEPGLAIYHGFFDFCGGAPNCVNPSTTSVDGAFFIGGRFHISDHLALTMRLGYPSFSFGVSFM